jgi:hypothetical protein
VSATAPPPASPAPPAGAPTPVGESCPLCAAPLGPEQEWCLSCGGAARTRLAAIPNWRAPLAALGLTIVLALGALTAALVSLAGESGSSVASAPPLTRTITTPVGVAPTSTTPGATSPLATTTTTTGASGSTPGVTTSGATAPGAAGTGARSPGATTTVSTQPGAAGPAGARTGTTATTPAATTPGTTATTPATTSTTPVLGGLTKSPKGKAAVEKLLRRSGNDEAHGSGSPAG